MAHSSARPVGRTHVLYEVSTGVRSTRNEDGAIVLNILAGQIFRVNSVGGLILERLKQGRTESQIIEEISSACRTTQEVVRADLGQFLQSLEKHGLLTWKSEEKE